MEFLEYFKNSFGVMSGTLTFVAFVLVIILLIFKNSIIELLKVFINKRKLPVNKIEDLQYHHLFVMVHKVSTRVDALDFTTYDDYDEVKSFLMKLLIQMKIDVVEKNFKDFLFKEGIDTVEPAKLSLMIASMLSSLVNEYNNDFIKKVVNNYGVSKKDAKYFVDCYEDHRLYMIEAFTDGLEAIVLDHNHHDNFYRINTIFYIVSLSLNVIPKDVVDAFNSLNGRFSKYDKKIFN